MFLIIEIRVAKFIFDIYNLNVNFIYGAESEKKASSFKNIKYLRSYDSDIWQRRDLAKEEPEINSSLSES